MIMKIIWDKESNTIRVGKAEFKNYIKFQNSAVWAKHILFKNDIKDIKINSFTKNTREQNKSISDALGCSRATLYSHYNKLQMKVFVSPVYHLLEKFAFKYGGFSSAALTLINANKNKLQEVYDDKLYNLLPVVAITGKSPQEMKQENKKAWRIIASNSLNKNKALAIFLGDNLGNLKWYDVALMQLPTSLLKHKGSNLQMLKYLEYNHKGIWSKPSKWQSFGYIFNDAVRLNQQLGTEEEINPKWTPRRVKEVHDKLTQDINAKKYSKDIFESTKNTKVKNMQHHGYEATLLDNAFIIAEEGNVMGHCVAGYSSSVKTGSYLVYSVTKSGHRSSTVGISIKNNWNENKTKPYHIMNQHYGKYNTLVESELEKEIANLLVAKLNEV